MPCQNFDATILLETPPKFEIRDGMVYTTDRIGGLTIRRVMRPATFRRTVLDASEALARWQLEQMEKVRAIGH
jgi:hypothetical protein